LYTIHIKFVKHNGDVTLKNSSISIYVEDLNKALVHKKLKILTIEMFSMIISLLFCISSSGLTTVPIK